MSKDYSKINDLTKQLQQNLRKIYEDDRTIYNTYKSVDNIESNNNLVGLPSTNEIDSYITDIINLFDNNTLNTDLVIDGNLFVKQITTNDIILPDGPLSEIYQAINNIQKSIDNIIHKIYLTEKYIGINSSKHSPVNISKTFVIDHPIKPNNYLVHACLEGPEAGVYYRGEGRIVMDDSICIVELPSYAEKIATNFTIHLTPILEENSIVHKRISSPLKDNTHSLLASRVNNSKFSVWSKYKCSFYWIVYGRRLSINVEPSKSDYDIIGNGPYNWLVSTNSLNTSE